MKLSGFKSSKCKYKANTTLCYIFLKNFKFYWSCRNRSVTNEEFISRFFFRCGERRKQYQDHDSCYVCALIYWSINAYVINCFSHTETEVTWSGFIILVLKTLFFSVSLCALSGAWNNLVKQQREPKLVTLRCCLGINTEGFKWEYISYIPMPELENQVWLE